MESYRENELVLINEDEEQELIFGENNPDMEQFNEAIKNRVPKDLSVFDKVENEDYTESNQRSAVQFYVFANGIPMVITLEQIKRIIGSTGGGTIGGIKFRVEGESLEVSYDDGETWTAIGIVKGETGEDGADGRDGVDGKTPYIQDGYWYIDGVNTNVKAEGADGISATHSWNGTTLTITSASGTSSANLKGEKGDKGEQGIQGTQGVQGIQGEQGIPGVKGDKGDKGDGFSIAKTYPSIVAMNAGYSTDGVPLNGFVLINTGNVNDADNAKLFVKLENGYSYLTDLSGSQGIQGEKGEKGEQGIQGEKGIQGEQGIQGVQGIQGEKGADGKDGNNGADGVGISKIEKTSTNGKVDTYTITLTNGTKSTFTVTNGNDGSNGANGTNGKDGKSAYAYAQEGGYAGTESEFARDTNPDNIKADNIAFISTELAKRGQLKPEFANSIEECTDTSKLYVLPDGYIYAYVSTTKTVEAYTNLLSSATDDTGAVFNGVGYVEKKRWGSSATTFGDYKDGDTTLVGMIPFTLGQVLRIKGINVSSTSDLTYTALRGFDASRKNIVSGYANLASYPDLAGATTIDVANNMITVHPTSNIYGMTDKMCYVAFTVFPTNGSENIIVTVDEEIKMSTVTIEDWANTGHAFVPADYEGRIVALESDVSKLKNQGETLEYRVSSLESSTDGSGVPSYVLAEAEEVATKVLSVRNAYSFVFGAISDIHSTGSDASTLHMGQGIYEIDKLTTLDACLNFGDGIDSYFENINADSFLHIHRCLHSVQREIPYIQMQGNHDQLKTDTTEDAQQKYFAYIGANNVGTVTDWDNRFRNYGYRDFPDQRMRVIYLNSVDVSEGENIEDCHLTAMQLSWLVDTALDFTDKEGWAFIVGCHHPLNWWYMDNLLTILNAYKGKASGSVTVDGTTVNYNFANATAEFIAHFHGHLHNFRAETLGSNNVLSITIPNACFGRNNGYGTDKKPDGTYTHSEEERAMFGDVDTNGNQRQFNKTAGTAEDTAFNVVVVDRENRKIHCFNYGAGIDRVISY